jgi:hypothetical protein
MPDASSAVQPSTRCDGRRLQAADPVCTDALVPANNTVAIAMIHLPYRLVEIDGRQNSDWQALAIRVVTE